MQDDWLTTSQVAQELGLSDDSVRRHIRERRIRAAVITTGERVTFRIRRRDLEAFRTAYVRDSLVDDWEE